MADLDAHADTIAKFYKHLTEGGVADQVAGVCTIDLNKILLSRETPDTRPTKQDQHDAVAAAAAKKAADRAAARGAA